MTSLDAAAAAEGVDVDLCVAGGYHVPGDPPPLPQLHSSSSSSSRSMSSGGSGGSEVVVVGSV